MGGVICGKCYCETMEESPAEYMERLERRERGIHVKKNRIDIMGVSLHKVMDGVKRYVGDEDYES